MQRVASSNTAPANRGLLARTGLVVAANHRSGGPAEGERSIVGWDVELNRVKMDVEVSHYTRRRRKVTDSP